MLSALLPRLLKDTSSQNFSFVEDYNCYLLFIYCFGTNLYSTCPKEPAICMRHMPFRTIFINRDYSPTCRQRLPVRKFGLPDVSRVQRWAVCHPVLVSQEAFERGRRSLSLVIFQRGQLFLCEPICCTLALWNRSTCQQKVQTI